MKRYITMILCLIGLLNLAGCSESLGTKLTFNGSNELYYTSNIKEEEAQKLGEFLVKEEFFTAGRTISAQINKEESTYEFRMVIKKGIEQDKDTIENMKIFAEQISKDVFNDKRVDIHLCDDQLETIRVVVY